LGVKGFSEVSALSDFNWTHALARRAGSIKPSPFVDLGPIWQTPDLIFFSGGTPPPERVPVERLRQAMLDAWEDTLSISSYGESTGHEPLRRLISERLGLRGAKVDPERVLVTNGSQQALDLVARVLFDPGDKVLVEGPTYFGALQAFDAYEVDYVVVPVDEDGIVPEALEQALASHGRVKALYTVSIFQNPTGVTIVEGRRRAILDLARAANVVVIEDDPYGELSFGDVPPRPLLADSPDVVYLGTFSKTLMPALRIGWVVFPPELGPPLLDSKEAVDIQSDRFVQRMIAGAAADGWLDEHIAESRALYRRRAETMDAALARGMPEGVTWTRPGGGFFTWVTLPDGLSADDLLPLAAGQGAGYLPGSFFYPDRRSVPALRLGYTTLSRERIEEGVARLAKAVRIALAGG
jgi:2-aminoadipate transaminase